jgi:NAD(P)-dependent dehydrogenase (short-subunit alcohol dehydrogenase family)
MADQPQKKTIIVTGCSSGIGAYCARALHAEGWQVIASARTAKISRRSAPTGLRRSISTIQVITASRNSSIKRWPPADGRCDALFNNGGYGQVGAVEDLPVEALRATVRS